MSLINQMLKDLEKRRADSVATPDSPLKGVNRYTVARQRPAYLVYLLVTALVILTGVATFLGWAYLDNSTGQQQSQQVGASTEKPASPQAEKAPQTQSRVATGKTSKSAVETPSQSKQDKAPVVESSTQQAVPAREQSDPVKTRHQADSEEETVSDSGISKRTRPLSGEQQAELAYKQGYQLLSRGRQEAAEKKLREALGHHQQHLRARELLAGLYIKAGRYVEAADLLKQGVSLAPEHTLFAKLYARVLLQQENVEYAIRVMERRPPPPAVDSEYHALLAVLYQRAGQYLKSAGRYRDVLRVNPRMGSWWAGLGISLEQLGKFDEALSAYQRAKSSGNLSKELMQFSDKRIRALQESGYAAQ